MRVEVGTECVRGREREGMCGEAFRGVIMMVWTLWELVARF